MFWDWDSDIIDSQSQHSAHVKPGLYYKQLCCDWVSMVLNDVIEYQFQNIF